VPLDDINGRYYGAKSSIFTIVDVIDSDINEIIVGETQTDYYYCVVKGLCSDIEVQSDPIQIQLAPEIVINPHPRSAFVCAGATASMFVTATSSNPNIPLSYQ
jgi:hypothetical protein